MAGRGQAPKGERSRARDTPDFDELDVPEPGVLYGDPLPLGVLPDDEMWHPQTLRMWDAIRAFPLLEHEPEFGWQALVDTMLMHHVMWMKGRWEFAAEIRLRLAKYGATPEDRMRLKIKVTTPTIPAAAAVPGVTNIDSRRARLSEGA